MTRYPMPQTIAIIHKRGPATITMTMNAKKNFHGFLILRINALMVSKLTPTMQYPITDQIKKIVVFILFSKVDISKQLGRCHR